MSNIVVDIWESFTPTTNHLTILPDGCRDVILTVTASGANHHLVSPYFETAQKATLLEGSHNKGFRLSPGSVIDEIGLFSNLQTANKSERNIVDLINEFVSVSDNTSDALKCIEYSTSSITRVAKELGVHTRTLQRHIRKETGLTPNYWLQLSRIRKAGRLVAKAHPLVDVALSLGYSDQSHLSRECSRWFGVTPKELRHRPDLFKQLEHPAFS